MADTERFYFIEKIDRSDFLARGTTDGGKAIMMFKNRDFAMLALERQGVAGSFTVAERTTEQAFELLTLAKHNGVTVVVPITTGTEDESNVRYLPIDAVLISLVQKLPPIQ